MADTSSRCVLIKGLSPDATVQDLEECLGKRNLTVLETHSHTESRTDKRWVVLFSSSEAARECIKQGSWKVNLPSGEVTVTPDYCSECIVPDSWIQKHEDTDEESLDESWTTLEYLPSIKLDEFIGSCHSHSTEQPDMTQVPVAKVQTTDIDAHEKSLQLASEDDTVTVFAEEIYQHAKFPPDMPLSEKVRPKDDDVSPQSPQMVDQNRDYTLFKSGSIPSTQMKYTGKQSQTVSRENLTKDTDHDRTQMKTYTKSGSINLSAGRNPWSSLLDPSVKNEDIDNQRKSGPGHEKRHLSSIPSTKRVESDEDEEGQTDINEGPLVAWSHEDPTIDNERSLSPVKLPSPSGGLDQGMQFPLPDMEDKASEEEIHQLTTEISLERMTMPEQQHIIGRYVQNITIPQSLTEVPSQNMNMPSPTLKLPQPHAEAASERQTLPQTNIDTQLPNMIMPQPITEVSVQSMHIDHLTPRSGNSSILAGQAYSAVPTWHVMPGQLNSSGVTDSHMVPPGHAGPYYYPLQTMPFIPPGGYQMNYGQIPWGHYGLTHLHPSPAVQHVLTTSSHPSCPPPPASFMSFMPPLRPQVGYPPPQGCISGLEKPIDIAGQWSAVTQAGPEEDDGSYVNITGKTQNINYAECVEKTKTTDRRGDDSEMKEDRPRSQIYPKLAEDPFQYNKNSLKNKDHHNRGNLEESQTIFQDDRHDAVEGIKSRKEGSSDALVDHIKRGMNIQSNKMVEGPPSEDDTERFSSLDSEGYERIKETDDAVAREIESKPQKENAQTSRMIRVLGLAKSVSKDALELFFENKKRSGGGEIDHMEWERNKGEAFITFKDPSVVQSVIEKQNREPFYLEQMKLTVEEYVPPPQDPLRLFLKNLSPKVTHELLILYLESRCNAAPTEILFGRLPGTALVTFSEPPDVELLLKKVKERPLEGQNIQVIRVPVTSSIQLSGLSLSTTRDTIELYFENPKRSDGGPVADVKLARKKQSCIVSFKHSEDAKRVCMRAHTIDRKDIKVCLYYECLDDDLEAEEYSDLTHQTEDTVDEFKLPDPVEFKDLNPQILRFLSKNEKHRQLFEKNLSDVNGVAKWPSSVEGYIIIECTVKMKDKRASSILKDWSSRVVDRVNSFTAGIEVVKFKPMQMAWSRVMERLQTVSIDNPEDLGVFVEQEKNDITVAGPKAAVEKLQKTILDIIAKVQTQIELEKQRVTETKPMKTYEMSLLRETHFKQDIEKMFPGLQFDLNQKDNRAVFVGQADIVQKAIVQMREKLRSFVSISMPMSKAFKDLLSVKEVTDYINQKMKSQKIIGVWYVFHQDECQMFGQNKREVQKAIQLVRGCYVEKEISLDDIMVKIVQEQQWSRLIQTIQEKHARKVIIETSMRSILIVAVDDIFQDVFDEINIYLEKHSVEELFLTLEPMRVKFIKRYKNEDIKALEMKFASSHVKLSVIDHGDKKGIKINGTRDVCSIVKTELAKMANTVFMKEHRIVSKEGLKEFLQGYEWADKLISIEKRFKCFIVVKDSGTSSSLEQEGATGGYSSKSEGNADPSYEAMDWQPSSDCGGDSIDVCGIKVSVVQEELAKQKVDVIVNSASQTFDLNVGAVSRTILKYGGDSIQSECRQQYHSGLNPGQVVVTNGGKLSCKKVYHGSLLDYIGSHGNPIEVMRTFVMNCLVEADKSGFKSMAFPALGTGNLGFPADEVGKLMVECIKTFGRKNTNLKNISLVVYPTDTNIIKAFTTVLFGTTVPSASTKRSASSSSNISTVHGICRCTLPHSVVLEIVQGDITKEKTDVIVNSVMSDLNLDQGEVSKAILTAGGMSIQRDCWGKDADFKKHGFVDTNSGRLLCKRIIHMAAQDEDYKWKDIIKRVLIETERSRYQSISFPALGTGGKGLSPEMIAQVMYSACTEFAKSQPVWLKKIRVVLFQETMLTRFVQAISVHNSGQGESQVSSTPVAGRYSTRKSKQSSLVFNITADSEFNFHEAIKDLEGFLKLHSF